jgi:Mg2+ and Co2+ transporter CorA
LDNAVSNDAKRDAIEDIRNSISRVVDEQHKKIDEINGALIKLQAKEVSVPEFDDSQIVARLKGVSDEVGSLKRKIGDSGDINKDLRLPQIITELEDLKLGVENFQTDLVKLLKTTSLVKGVGLSEKVK